MPSDPTSPGPGGPDPAGLDRIERRRRGAWYTPSWLIDHVLAETVAPLLARSGGPATLVVADPACGDGRFLVAARALAPDRVEAIGAELDPATAAATRATTGFAITTTDAFTHTWPVVDAVVGNPPFLGQLATATRRTGRDRVAGGPYADAAAELLALALRSVRPGGRVGLVLPASVLASRDAAPVRAEALERAALVSLWWAGTTVFDAGVHVCVIVLEAGAPPGPIRRFAGPRFVRHPDADGRRLSGSAPWAPLVADLVGVPDLDVPPGPTIGSIADCFAAFRDEFYAIAAATIDEPRPEPRSETRPDDRPVITTGLIDLGADGWGRRPARLGGHTYLRPIVPATALTDDRPSTPTLARWWARTARPKVLLATQTAVLEGAPDPAGDRLPCTPVIVLAPHDPSELDRLTIAANSPVGSALAARAYLGTARSPGAIKLSAKQAALLPCPVLAPDDARALAGSLRAGALDAFVDGASRAHGLTATDADALAEWWLPRARRQRGASPAR